MSQPGETSSRLIRFTLYERLVHWTVVALFVYLSLTGLAFWSPRLYWLAVIFGGAETVRAWHPWAGLAFTFTLLLMFIHWARFMILDRDDRIWLTKAHRYAQHDMTDLPDAGRFNAGQKAMFWIQSLCAVLLLASGMILWWPDSTPLTWRLIAIVVHPAAAAISITGILVHIYMATAATPGSLRGMIHGWVPSDWARDHHPKWFLDIIEHQSRTNEREPTDVSG